MSFVLKIIVLVNVCTVISLAGCQDSTQAYTGEDQDTTLVINPDTLTTAHYNADSLVRLPPGKPK